MAVNRYLYLEVAEKPVKQDDKRQKKNIAMDRLITLKAWTDSSKQTRLLQFNVI